jgi:hypothetical protein
MVGFEINMLLLLFERIAIQPCIFRCVRCLSNGAQARV